MTDHQELQITDAEWEVMQSLWEADQGVDVRDSLISMLTVHTDHSCCDFIEHELPYGDSRVVLKRRVLQKIFRGQ